MSLRVDLLSGAEVRAKVRRKGLVRFLIDMACFVVGLAISLLLLHYGMQLNPMGLALFAIPGAYGLTGLLELTTGTSFVEFATRWDQLKGWQRGVFGTFIVLVGGFLVCLLIALAASYL